MTKQEKEKAICEKVISAINASTNITKRFVPPQPGFVGYNVYHINDDLTLGGGYGYDVNYRGEKIAYFSCGANRDNEYGNLISDALVNRQAELKNKSTNDFLNS
jgi:hypothetical protein